MTSPAASSPEIGAAGFESGRTLYFPCFDAFRFFGMTMVLLVHAAFATRPWVQEHLPQWMQALLQRMDVGVAIFFVEELALHMGESPTGAVTPESLRER